MKAIRVCGIGVCASGLPDWKGARAVLRGEAPFELAPPARKPIEALPQTERRRINETSRYAFLAAQDAVGATGDAATVPTIFATADGDGTVLSQMLTALAQPEIVVSPTAFHNSVFNAPAGYWGIATRSTSPSTTLCAGPASFAAALLEARAQARAPATRVLVVAADGPFPEAIRALGRSAAVFACGLVLDDAPGAEGVASIGGWSFVEGAMPTVDPLSTVYAGNASAAALPLLRAIACGQAVRIRLPYADGASLELEVSV
jgi:beta-ketoacyl synthase-like protein